MLKKVEKDIRILQFPHTSSLPIHQKILANLLSTCIWNPTTSQVLHYLHPSWKSSPAPSELVHYPFNWSPCCGSCSQDTNSHHFTFLLKPSSRVSPPHIFTTSILTVALRLNSATQASFEIKAQSLKVGPLSCPTVLLQFISLLCIFLRYVK